MSTTTVCGKQGHAPCKILSLQQSLFMPLECHGDHESVMKLS